ncbi:MAG: triose-phosphate isomerase, partial [Campylobacter sp.]|nr:triose-phosphate isomerase [Campylobacter sp.]
NIAEISQIPSCDGVLVGTASWSAENFINLIKEVK